MLLSLAAPFLLLTSAPAPAPSSAAPSVPRLLVPGTTALARGLDAIASEHIAADVDFIGSDALGGRDTPSNGLEVAARYLRARLQRLGWEPGAEDGYFHRYELAYNKLDEEASLAHLSGPGGERDLLYAESYFLSSSRAVTDIELEAGVVFCGTGSSEEVEELDLAGRWALCLDGDVHWRKRMRACQKAGAAGIAVIPADASEEPFAERFDRVVRSTRRARVGWPSERQDGEPPFPMIYLAVTDAAVAQLAGREGGLTELAPGTELDLTLRETRKREGKGGRIELENVCGFWPGDDPELSKEVILVSAHYDHVGTTGDDIYNGADDNGSGTCGLLALAEGLVEYGPMRRSVMLIWVSGEEKGLLGSRAWAAEPWLPEGCRAVANINIDMIGRNADDYLLITPTSDLDDHYNGLTRLAEKHSAAEGFPKLGSADDYWSRSDHAMFAKLDIPVTFLFSDVHEDYHKPTDTPDKINPDKIRRVMRLVLRMLDGLQGDELGM